MADSQFNPLGSVTAPADWTLPASLNLELKNVYASFNGSAATSSFVPCLQIISDSGHTVGSYPCASTVAAGGSADVTWFPSVGSLLPKPLPPDATALYDYTLTTSATTIDTRTDGPNAGAIPTTYAVLTIWVVVQSDRAAKFDTLFIQFNGDTGANYDNERLQGNDASATASFTAAAAGTGFAMSIAASSLGSYASTVRCSVPAYGQSAFYKSGEMLDTIPAALAADNFIFSRSQVWKSTNPITSVQLALSTVGAKMQAGTRLTVLAQ